MSLGFIVTGPSFGWPPSARKNQHYSNSSRKRRLLLPTIAHSPALQHLSFGVRCQSATLAVLTKTNPFCATVYMRNLNPKQVTLIIDELESSLGPKIYCHRALSRDTLQEILGMNWHETIRQNIDRFIWDYQHGPKGHAINMRGPKA